MAEASSESSPVSVIGSEFMAPDEMDIIVYICSSGKLLITNTTHTIILKVEPCDTFFHRRRQVLDADDNPIVLISDKLRTLHHRWNVFKGDGKSDSDILIFTTKTPDLIQFRSNVHVCLENKTSSSKDICDFSIKGSWSKRNCTIYMGDTASTPIAQMSKNVKFGNDRFVVTISPNVDYAFVVTLLAILEAEKMSISKDKQVVVAATRVGVDIAAAAVL